MKIEYLEGVVAEEFRRGDGEVRRLFHGRGGVYPGLNNLAVDLFYPLLLLTVYREMLPDEERWLRTRMSAFCEANGLSTLMIQYRSRSGAPAESVWGVPVDSSFPVKENDLIYQVYPGNAQNAGFFPDMVNGRLWVRKNSQKRRVLNSFAYTCSLSVAALAGGASSVVNVDMNSNVLETGRENHRSNGLAGKRVYYLAHDIFKSWGKIRRMGPYDLVIFDPPTCQRGSFVAETDYAKLFRQIPGLMPEGGLIFAALNAPGLSFHFLLEESRRVLGERVTLCQRLGAPSVYAENNLEEGLKIAILAYQNADILIEKE